MSAAKTKPRSPARSRRDLVEQVAVGVPGGSPLRVDRDAGIIYRVKVLGRYSRNSHGLTEAENGSEYTPACMRAALAMYEDAKVRKNHPADRARPGAERDVDDTVGVLRNVRVESDESGEPAVWADLHYNRAKPFSAELVEDVERGLGVYGLSHNAAAKRERFDPASRRLVIEELAIVRSVDLVDKPATNRNLWESAVSTKTVTLRQLLEARLPKLSKARTKIARALLEDDAMTGPMDSPADVPAEGGDEDDALWTGFQSAIQKVLDSYKSGECDAKECGKKIADWLKAHDKLTGSAEPAAPAGDATESDDDEDDKDKQESLELQQLRSEKKARELCESLGLAAPTAVQIAAVAGLTADKQKRELIESFRGKTAAGFKTPKSTPAGGTKPAGDKPRDVQESTAAEDLAALRIG